MNEAIKSIQDKIDNYCQTIIAIVGFMNFYRYDCSQNPVLVFQGRRLQPSQNKDIEYVTPDIGILLPNNTGVLGEVKHTFPVDRNLWMDVFEQILKYDDNLFGWPKEDGVLDNHDLVLLTQQARARAVRNYYRDKVTSGEIIFTRPFIIVEYNLTFERQEYFFFRIEDGSLTDSEVNSKLQEGVLVPMSIILRLYATIKLYDDKPELPYLMNLIWVYVVLDKASESERFKNLAKNQKLDVVISVDEIAEILRNGYSFHSLNSDNSERQPLIPKKFWVKEACQKFVQWGEAKWNDDLRSSLTFRFHKKYADALDHFIKVYVGEGVVGQQTLFNDINPEEV